MLRHTLVCALGALLGANALAQGPATVFSSANAFPAVSPGAPPPGGASLVAAANDECTAPLAVVGGGPFPFDTTQGTTGATGQNNAACNIGPSVGINFDLWYSWQAPSTGLASLTTCQQGAVDTKIAVYSSTTCPPGAAIACSDESCGLTIGQTEVSFQAVSGQTYMFQLGNFPGSAAGAGNFLVTVNGQLPCGQIDNGVTETTLGFTNGGDLVWMQSFGTIGQQTILTTVKVVYGPGFNAASPPNGSPARVAVWKDPNDDGNPTDAQLLAVVNTTTANVGNATFNTVALPSALSITGMFFIGVSEPHGAGQFVTPDDSDGPSPSMHRAWLFGNVLPNAAPADLVNVNNNTQQPLNIAALAHVLANFSEASLLIRYDCVTSPGLPFCSPGASGVIACQCGNLNGAGAGCSNTGSSGGKLDTAGVASLALDSVDPGTVSLIGTNLLSGSTVIFLQGPAQVAAGVTFGGGIRCVSGQLMRLYVKQGIVAGAKTVPEAADRSISNRTTDLFPGLPITNGSTWFYQAYYRDPGLANPGLPCPVNATFNITAGQKITWGP